MKLELTPETDTTLEARLALIPKPTTRQELIALAQLAIDELEKIHVIWDNVTLKLEDECQFGTNGDEIRIVERFENSAFVKADMLDLKKGDVFKLSEADGTYIGLFKCAGIGFINSKGIPSVMGDSLE